MAFEEPFPDIEAALVASLGTGTVTRLPADLQTRLPLRRVRRVGGGDNRITDVARVDIEIYAASRAAAMDAAREIQQRLISAPFIADDVVIDRCTTEVGPHEVAYPDETTRLVSATYRIAARR